MSTLTRKAGQQLTVAIRESTQAEIAASLVNWARDDLALSIDEIAETLGASARSVSRWAAHEVPPSPEYRDRIERLSELRHLLESVFRDVKSRVAWISSPLPALRGRSPVAALRKQSWDEVLGILAGLESGSFG